MAAHQPHAPTVASAAKDPVCGMTVDAATTPHHATHAGTDYHFCGARCRERFLAEPAKFLAPRPASAAPTPAEPAREYTCPMHPEIVQRGPGTCPICGMALEPRSFDFHVEEQPDPELADMKRRLAVSAALIGRASCRERVYHPV